MLASVCAFSMTKIINMINIKYCQVRHGLKSVFIFRLLYMTSSRQFNVCNILCIVIFSVL